MLSLLSDHHVLTTELTDVPAYLKLIFLLKKQPRLEHLPRQEANSKRTIVEKLDFHNSGALRTSAVFRKSEIILNWLPSVNLGN